MGLCLHISYALYLREKHVATFTINYEFYDQIHRWNDLVFLIIESITTPVSSLHITDRDKVLVIFNYLDYGVRNLYLHNLECFSLTLPPKNEVCIFIRKKKNKQQKEHCGV